MQSIPNEPEPVLLLEFSTPRKSASIWVGAKRLASLCADAPPCEGHWPLLLRQVLTHADRTAAELQAVAVGLGPGSYAGIRTALSVAQGLCLPAALPVLGINSAAAWAYAWQQAHDADSKVTVIGDARRGYFWVGRFDKGTRPFHDERDFVLVKPAELAGVVDPDAVILCPDASRIGSALDALLPSNRLVLDTPLPDADRLGHWLAHHPGSARATPQPIYLFPPVRAQG